ncbi:unnamed protein product, partial [Amoebophrya sp. A25]
GKGSPLLPSLPYAGGSKGQQTASLATLEEALKAAEREEETLSEIALSAHEKEARNRNSTLGRSEADGCTLQAQHCANKMSRNQVDYATAFGVDVSEEQTTESSMLAVDLMRGRESSSSSVFVLTPDASPDRCNKNARAASSGPAPLIRRADCFP